VFSQGRIKESPQELPMRSDSASATHAARSSTWKRVAGHYGFAVLASIAMLWIRMEVAASFDDRPLLILLVFPIVLSAMLGGIGPGLAATAVSAAGIDYLAIPPRGSFAIAESHDVIQWAVLIANGILVSILSEGLHRALRRADLARVREAEVAAQLDNNKEWLRESEITYQSLFDHMLNGLAYCRMEFDAGRPVDFTYLSVNDAFGKLTGLEDVVGRKVSEVIPGIRESDPQLFEIYGRVAQGGRPESFETYLSALQMWFSVSVYCPQQDYFVAIFDVITQRKQAEATQLEAIRMLQTVVDTVPHFIFWKDRQSRYLGCNRALTELAGLGSPQELIGKSDYDMPWREYAHLYQADDAAVMETGIPKYNIVEPLDLGHGGVHWLETSKEPLRDQEGRVFGVLGVFQDVTVRKRIEERLRQAAKVFESTTEGVMITDESARIIAVNQAFCDLTGFAEEEVIGRLPNILKSEQHEDEFYRAMWASIARTGTWSGEIWNRRKSGEIFPAWETINTVKDDAGRTTNYVAVFSDIGNIKNYEARLEYLANHDPLTRLPNRLLLSDRLELALQRSKREGKKVVVLFIDLDDFKKVNDGLGHPVGDQLLQAVAARLIESVRGEDTVGRLGGDEFIVIMEGLAELNPVSGMAEKILQTLKTPFVLGDHTIFIGASIGISTYPDDEADGIGLLKNADAAMYRAKEAGRNTFCFYSAELTRAARDHINLEAALRRAISEQEFVLHFQPQLEVHSNRIIGVEALVRWDHPQSGLIAPVRFIPFAEQTGLIVPLGAWVLRAACRQVMDWLAAGLPPITVAVNLSARQFQQNHGVVAEVRQVLAETGLPPHLLELEITEGAIMEQGEQAIHTLTALKALGVKLAIDDFGTGYSSLAYLRRFPIDVLKIDQSFMRDVPADRGAMEIAVTIIAMARNLHLRVLAEGVETDEQLGFLKAHRCDSYQGYLCSRPLPAADFLDMLRCTAA
jgi:diguanylate cyclase (GGDEF)-like protein/PAS domain S-box-containing protein